MTLALARDPRRPLVAGVLAAGLVLCLGATSFAQGVSVTVEPVAGLSAGATTVSITGTGFSTSGNGIYVVFGPVTPAPGYHQDPSIYGAFKWVHPGEGGSALEAPLAADGSFSTTLEVASVFTAGGGVVDCAVTACAVITFAAHGAPDRSQDTCTAITFVAAGPASPAPGASPASASGAPVTSVAPTGSAEPTVDDACSIIDMAGP